MRIPRVYINLNNQKLVLNNNIILPKETANHIIKVLKRKIKDKLIIFNNQKDNSNQYGEYTTEIIDFNKNKLIIKILDYKNIKNISNINTELAQCISKSHHFETTLQKSVELGVNIITPIFSERAEQKINYNNIDKKIERWQKIIINAAEQCGRCDLPILNKPIELDLWLNLIKNNNTNNSYLLTLCTKTDNKIKNLINNKINYNIFKIIIGPEGGLSDLELNKLNSFNFNFIKLGDRILRTETASIAILAILQSQFGDL